MVRLVRIEAAPAAAAPPLERREQAERNRARVDVQTGPRDRIGGAVMAVDDVEAEKEIARRPEIRQPFPNLHGRPPRQVIQTSLQHRRSRLPGGHRQDGDGGNPDRQQDDVVGANQVASAHRDAGAY
jgi:hypothetical protein